MRNETFIALLLALVFAACSTPENEKGGTAQAGAPMMMMDPWETIEVTKANPKVPLKLSGELKPDQQAELFAKVSGYVKTLHMDIGDRVKAGQVLLVLEAPELQAQVANAKAKVSGQEAINESTRSTFDRMARADRTDGAIAKDAMDRIEAQRLADEAQFEAAKAAYAEIVQMNDYLVIRAPFSGLVTARNVDLGDYVGPMDKTALLVVEENRVLRLNLAVPEASTPYVHLGDTIRFTVRSRPQDRFQAIVKRKSGSLDQKLRTEKVEADLLNTEELLKPHMIAEATVQLQHTEETFFIPKMALVESGMGIYVIQVQDGKTRNLPVRKGRAMADRVEVFGDLAVGQRILKKGSEEIKEGTPVPVKGAAMEAK
ncbi:MAG: efflux RND transporter periplasmic adaptor subunit [Flavobacteriales bacterium]|jgi:membrane fusion protein (multidrug efflux system)|nr:efflux RND transporter periplasmic adaptor subunit [Flavobacteriales bacterium]